jgi:hypothetical protein
MHYPWLMTPEQAESALQAWATVQRDDLVRAAYRAGVSKNRIHTLTGIARTTVDRILEAPMGTTTEALAEYLATFTQAWPRQPQRQPWAYNLPRYPHAATIASQHTASEVAQWLLADTAFKALKLGNWLSTPDGKLLMAAIEMLAPAPYAQDIELLAEALQIASRQQQADARAKIAAAIAIGGAAALAIGSAGGK